MNYTSNFEELENQAKLSATKLIADTFQRNESLDKVAQFIKRFKSQEEATEAQLKLAIQIQLDNVKDGLEKLDHSYVECCKIQERTREISNCLVDIHSLSNGLEDLQSKSKKQKQLAAAMDNMDYLEKVPKLIIQARNLIESSNFLLGHKIIEELESIRDEIISELFRQECSESDLHVLDAFFCGVEKLNEQLLSHVKWMGQRVVNACITQNKVLVNCIRIIEREERIDLTWEKNKSFCPMPSNRPKSWKNEFFSMVKSYISDKIFESALDGEEKKGFLPRHLEAIRCHTVADLKIIKNIGVIYFPPHYRVYDEFVRMYHDAISKYVKDLASGILDEVESFQLLGWVNQYHASEFMGSPELDIKFNQLGISNPRLLSEAEYDNIAQQYLERQKLKLQSWFNNSIRTDEEDWVSESMPPLDGDGCYHTQILSLVLKPLTEMIGRDKVLQYLGERVRENYYPMFLTEFMGFQDMFKSEIQLYRDKYMRIPICYKVEYLVANCNNCLRLDAALNEMVKNDLKNSPAIQVKVDSALKSISKAMLDIAQLCLDLLIELMFRDLADIFAHVLTDDWNRQNYRVVDFILGTVEDYNNTYIYLKPVAHKRLLKAIVRRIVIEYLRALLTRRPNLAADDRKRVASTLYFESDKILFYFRDNMHLDVASTECVEVLKLISNLIQNSDKTMMRLDIGTLIRNFPSIRKDQMISLLMLRGDTKMAEAKEIAIDFSFASPEDRTNIFHDVALSMGQN